MLAQARVGPVARLPAVSTAVPLVAVAGGGRTLLQPGAGQDSEGVARSRVHGPDATSAWLGPAEAGHRAPPPVFAEAAGLHGGVGVKAAGLHVGGLHGLHAGLLVSVTEAAGLDGGVGAETGGDHGGGARGGVAPGEAAGAHARGGAAGAHGGAATGGAHGGVATCRAAGAHGGEAAGAAGSVEDWSSSMSIVGDTYPNVAWNL